MSRITATLIGGSLALAGCGAATDNISANTNAPDTTVVSTNAPAPVQRASPIPVELTPAAPVLRTAPPVAPEAGSAEAAADVVRRYHAAIAAKRYDEAYSLWEPGAVGMTADAFARSFARYAAYRATVGAPGRIDAGAGQRYVEVPVTVTGTLAGGGSFKLEGPTTLHRTGDIDGATPEQRSWRIRASGLKPRP